MERIERVEYRCNSCGYITSTQPIGSGCPACGKGAKNPWPKEYKWTQNDEDKYRKISKKQCRHMGCEKCHGSGVDARGNICVHMIYCDCPNCAPFTM